MHEELDSAAAFAKNIERSELVTSEIEHISCYADAECTSCVSDLGRSGEEFASRPRARRRLQPSMALAPPVIGA
jgi:hypothetical protein